MDSSEKREYESRCTYTNMDNYFRVTINKPYLGLASS